MGTMNTLGDLNNHLFAAIERLNDEDLTDEQLEKEIRRCDAIEGVAKQIISNAEVVLKACQFNDERMDADRKAPRMLEGNK